jgi:glyoxylase-like metal-dependent hydrolase (beta-lactamase superfamily II)
LAGNGGTIVVDTGRHVAHTRAILAFAPVAVVINTHWHLDHIGGNALIRREVPNVKIYASGAFDDALTGFLANYAKQLEGVIAKTTGEEQQRYRTELALIQSGKELGPDEVIGESKTRTFGGRLLDVGLAKDAATAGDVWILDRATGTLISGDLVTLPFPFLDTACPKGWSSALARLAGTDFRLLVPGHGAPMDRKQFERYRTSFDNLLACGAAKRASTECADGWIKDVGDLIAESDHEFVRQALDYYVPNFLRPDAHVSCE